MEPLRPGRGLRPAAPPGGEARADGTAARRGGGRPAVVPVRAPGHAPRGRGTPLCAEGQPEGRAHHAGPDHDPAAPQARSIRRGGSVDAPHRQLFDDGHRPVGHPLHADVRVAAVRHASRAPERAPDQLRRGQHRAGAAERSATAQPHRGGCLAGDPRRESGGPRRARPPQGSARAARPRGRAPLPAHPPRVLRRHHRGASAAQHGRRGEPLYPGVLHGGGRAARPGRTRDLLAAGPAIRAVGGAGRDARVLRGVSRLHAVGRREVRLDPHGRPRLPQSSGRGAVLPPVARPDRRAAPGEERSRVSRSSWGPRFLQTPGNCAAGTARPRR